MRIGARPAAHRSHPRGWQHGCGSDEHPHDSTPEVHLMNRCSVCISSSIFSAPSRLRIALLTHALI